MKESKTDKYWLPAVIAVFVIFLSLIMLFYWTAELLGRIWRFD